MSSTDYWMSLPCVVNCLTTLLVGETVATTARVATVRMGATRVLDTEHHVIGSLVDRGLVVALFAMNTGRELAASGLGSWFVTVVFAVDFENTLHC